MIPILLMDERFDLLWSANQHAFREGFGLAQLEHYRRLMPSKDSPWFRAHPVRPYITESAKSNDESLAAVVPLRLFGDDIAL